MRTPPNWRLFFVSLSIAAIGCSRPAEVDDKAAMPAPSTPEPPARVPSIRAPLTTNLPKGDDGTHTKSLSVVANIFAKPAAARPKRVSHSSPRNEEPIDEYDFTVAPLRFVGISQYRRNPAQKNLSFGCATFIHPESFGPGEWTTTGRDVPESTWLVIGDGKHVGELAAWHVTSGPFAGAYVRFTEETDGWMYEVASTEYHARYSRFFPISE